MQFTNKYKNYLKPLCIIMLALAWLLSAGVAANAQSRSEVRGNKTADEGREGTVDAMKQFLEGHPTAGTAADRTFPQGMINYGPNGETQKSMPAGINPGVVWPELAPPTQVMGSEHVAARMKMMNSILDYQNPQIGVYPLTANMAAMITSVATQMEVDSEQSPENTIPRAKEEQNQANQTSADTNANQERAQAGSAIDYVAHYLENFTVDKDNKWNKVRDQLFLPMAILILLPGAVLAQVKAVVSAGSPVIADVASPFEGILRSIVAIFLIPGTYLVVNYGIDVSNSITHTINSEYKRIFGTDMYKDAMCSHIRAFPVRNLSENKGYVPNQKAQMGKLGQNDTPFADFEGKNIENKLTDPCANLDETPADRTNEQVSYLVNSQRNSYNTVNSALAMTWNILCAFQMAYLYYLWFVGPVIAALWVYPMQQLRDALPSWINGVCTICFWSLFWNTAILLMACLRGVDETGTMMMTALNFLSTACVKFAFDFAGMAKEAGMKAAQGGGGGKGASSGGSKGASAPASQSQSSGGGGGGGGGGGSPAPAMPTKTPHPVMANTGSGGGSGGGNSGGSFDLGSLIPGGTGGAGSGTGNGFGIPANAPWNNSPISGLNVQPPPTLANHHDPMAALHALMGQGGIPSTSTGLPQSGSDGEDGGDSSLTGIAALMGINPVTGSGGSGAAPGGTTGTGGTGADNHHHNNHHNNSLLSLFPGMGGPTSGGPIDPNNPAYLTGMLAAMTNGTGLPGGTGNQGGDINDIDNNDILNVLSGGVVPGSGTTPPIDPAAPPLSAILPKLGIDPSSIGALPPAYGTGDSSPALQMARDSAQQHAAEVRAAATSQASDVANTAAAQTANLAAQSANGQMSALNYSPDQLAAAQSQAQAAAQAQAMAQAAGQNPGSQTVYTNELLKLANDITGTLPNAGSIAAAAAGSMTLNAQSVGNVDSASQLNMPAGAQPLGNPSGYAAPFGSMDSNPALMRPAADDNSRIVGDQIGKNYKAWEDQVTDRSNEIAAASRGAVESSFSQARNSVEGNMTGGVAPSAPIPDVNYAQPTQSQVYQQQSADASANAASKAMNDERLRDLANSVGSAPSLNDQTMPTPGQTPLPGAAAGASVAAMYSAAVLAGGLAAMMPRTAIGGSGGVNNAGGRKPTPSGVVMSNRADAYRLMQKKAPAAAPTNKGGGSKLSAALGRAKTPAPTGGDPRMTFNPRKLADPMGSVATGTALRRLRTQRKASSEEMDMARQLGGIINNEKDKQP